jgi:hypothetical protein
MGRSRQHDGDKSNETAIRRNVMGESRNVMTKPVVEAPPTFRKAKQPRQRFVEWDLRLYVAESTLKSDGAFRNLGGYAKSTSLAITELRSLIW